MRRTKDAGRRVIMVEISARRTVPVDGSVTLLVSVSLPKSTTLHSSAPLQKSAPLQ